MIKNNVIFTLVFVVMLTQLSEEGAEREILLQEARRSEKYWQGKNAKEDGLLCSLHVSTTWDPQITAFGGITCHLAHHVPSSCSISGLLNSGRPIYFICLIYSYKINSTIIIQEFSLKIYLISLLINLLLKYKTVIIK